jgi:ketol-acid reductoisomerase
MDDIISGHFSKTMMEDWDNDDKNLLKLGRLLQEILISKKRLQVILNFRASIMIMEF